MKSCIAKVALAFGVAAACTVGLVACSSGDGSGATAATVNGTEIKEQKVTDQIESIRKQSGLAEEEEWGKFLAENDMTPSSVRDQILDSLVEQTLVEQGAPDLGVSVEDSEVDEYVNKMKDNYGGDDEKWKSALDQAGLTEDGYRDMIKQSLLDQKIDEHFENEAEISDEDLATAAKSYASSNDGAKRSSHILFKVDNKTDEAAMTEARTQAEQVLAQINAGGDFAELAKQYSADTASAEKGGDVGWDNLNSFVTEYTDALDNLELNQVSGLVESTYGIHIIKCTDVFKASDDITSIDQLPQEFQDKVRSSEASGKSAQVREEWVQGLKDKGDIKKNDMPSGLPYDLDMSKYKKSEDEGSGSESSSDVNDSATLEVEDGDAAEVEVEEESSSSSSAAK